ncbi:hypothetical protein RBH29_13735 [Herbivorax sp. ANBcel31]|uniref:hypothetical protein n=1 Tax=Herbivorax sp. ANBcel31 TaxID=3069754 RepID=UPI0027B14845|nr:hypothetical protein [Herbivorax sp. ANBcel31]MDQ2087488.1 hypothetical protein [Herbivorax sp. ANBcel31]
MLNKIIKLSIIIIISGVVFAISSIQGDFAMITNFIWFLVTGLSIIALPYVIYKGLKNKVWSNIIINLVLIIVMVLSLLISDRINENLRELSRNEGDKIISAINIYQDKEGSLPDTLDCLVPKYLSEIPTSQMFFTGSPYEYEILEDDYYQLRFLTYKGVFNSCNIYYSECDRWTVYD